MGSFKIHWKNRLFYVEAIAPPNLQMGTETRLGPLWNHLWPLRTQSFWEPPLLLGIQLTCLCLSGSVVPMPQSHNLTKEVWLRDEENLQEMNEC